MSAWMITLPLAIIIGWFWSDVEEFLDLGRLSFGSIVLLFAVVFIMNITVISVMPYIALWFTGVMP